MPKYVIDYMTKDEQQHLAVLEEAMALFQERSEFRGDMWRQFPISDKVRELDERIKRMQAIRGTGSFRPDVARDQMRSEAIDVMNYAAFIVKQIDEGFDL